MGTLTPSRSTTANHALRQRGWRSSEITRPPTRRSICGLSRSSSSLVAMASMRRSTADDGVGSHSELLADVRRVEVFAPCCNLAAGIDLVDRHQRVLDPDTVHREMIHPFGHHNLSARQDFRDPAMQERRKAALPLDFGTKGGASFDHRAARHPQLPYAILREHADDLVDVRSSGRAVAPRIAKFNDDLLFFLRHHARSFGAFARWPVSRLISYPIYYESAWSPNIGAGR